MSSPNQVADKVLQGQAISSRIKRIRELLIFIGRSALVKLFTFSISLAVVPIGSYFLSLKYIWVGTSCLFERFTRVLTLVLSGDTTAAALVAVFMANLVLVAYIIVSVQEESKARTGTVTAPDETKKTQ